MNQIKHACTVRSRLHMIFMIFSFPPRRSTRRQPSKVVAHDVFKLHCLRVDLIDTIPSANIGSNWIPSMESMQYTHCLRREPSCYTVECTNQVDHASCGMNPSYDMQWKMLHYRLPGQHQNEFQQNLQVLAIAATFRAFMTEKWKKMENLVETYNHCACMLHLVMGGHEIYLTKYEDGVNMEVPRHKPFRPSLAPFESRCYSTILTCMKSTQLFGVSIEGHVRPPCHV